jgi:hypothetical protein
MQYRSRGAVSCARVCQTAKERPPEQIRGGGAPRGASKWAPRPSPSAFRLRENREQAARRRVPVRVHRLRGGSERSRSPFGAPPRRSPRFYAWLSSGPALHGIWMCDHPSPRAASSSRAGRSASRAGSRSRPGAGLRTPRAGTAFRSIKRPSPVDALATSGTALLYARRQHCQGLSRDARHVPDFAALFALRFAGRGVPRRAHAANQMSRDEGKPRGGR